MSMRHANISIFVPHIGCPNTCSFCNQRYITGSYLAPRQEDVDKVVALATTGRGFDPKNTEIAFFGGSFTAINHNYMISLLDAAHKYIENGTVSGIRISTRPDAIDCEILETLKSYGVTSIELGAQSLDDKVLRLNNRGHTSQDVIDSSELIKDYGFSLGLQMMTGLYGDNDEKSIITAKKIISLKPDTVRIYPTIVLNNTDLSALYTDGLYTPQTLNAAVDLASKLLLLFYENGIDVIRLGLHSIEPGSYIAGPWHPAFSELCQSKIYLNKVLESFAEKGSYIIYVNPKEISKMIGQQRTNINYLSDIGYECVVKPNEKLNRYEIITERI